MIFWICIQRCTTETTTLLSNRLCLMSLLLLFLFPSLLFSSSSSYFVTLILLPALFSPSLLFLPLPWVPIKSPRSLVVSCVCPSVFRYREAVRVSEILKGLSWIWYYTILRKIWAILKVCALWACALPITLTLTLSIPLYVNSYINNNTVKLHLSRLIGTASHPDVQKIRIIGFFFENRLHWQFEIRLLLFTVCTRI